MTCITEVTGRTDDAIQSQDLFHFVQDSVDDKGQVRGHFDTTGAVPTFISDLKAKGLGFNATLFEKK